jgi:hypothetical protein
MRPILVLLLVIAAIAALFIGVSSLLKDNPAPPTTIATPTAKDVAKAPAAPLGGETDAKAGRTAELAKPGKDSRAPAADGGTGAMFNNSLTGIVQNAQGTPLKDVEVSLSTIPPPGGLMFVQDLPAESNDVTVRTAPDGHFVFRSIPPRNHYTIIAKHPDYARREIESVPVQQEGAFEEPPIILTPGATLAGHVRDEQNNLIPDAVLYLEGMQFQAPGITAPDRITAKTNGQGEYKFANVQRGERSLTVTASGYGRQTVNGLKFDKDETVPRDIVLRAAEMIAGRVIGPNNTGLKGAVVSAIGFNASVQSARGQATTDDKGEFTFEDLSPGDYNLICSLKGYRLQQPARAHTNGDRVVLEMLKEASVCGQVVDDVTSAPVTSFTCRVRIYYGEGMATAPADTNTQQVNDPKGEYCIEGVPQSEYVVEAMAPGYAPSLSARFQVAPGKDMQGIVVRMGKGGSMSGRVIDPDGKPVARARITTHDDDWTDDEFTASLGINLPSATTPVDVRTDGEGRFQIPNLAAASYQVIFEAPGYTNLVKHGITITKGVDQPLGDVRMARGGSLRGTLFDPSGAKLAGGRVSLRPAQNGGPTAVYDTKSGVDGTFTFVNVQPGTYILSGSRAGGGDANPLEMFKDARNSQKQVTIAENESKVLDVTLSAE